VIRYATDASCSPQRLHNICPMWRGVCGQARPTPRGLGPHTPPSRLPDLHFHDLRHESISRFFEMGLTTPEIASISGHRDIRMLMRYAHPMRQRIIEQMDKGEVRNRS
jgi:integrase